MFSFPRSVVLGLLTLAVTTVAVAGPFQDKPERNPPSPDVDAAKAVLGKMLGTWTTTLSQGEGSELVKGTSVISPVQGASFVHEVFKAKMGGQPFMGMGILGYDAEMKRWRQVWVDSFEPGMSLSLGDWDDESLSLVSRSEAHGDTPARMSILKLTGRDSMSYVTGDDTEDFKPSMVVFYERRK
jgi:hypothetical protein